MGRLIVASKGRAKVPYTFKEIGIDIYTLEELYYLCYTYFEIVIDTFPDKTLVEWVKDELNSQYLWTGVERETEQSQLLLAFMKNSNYIDHEDLENLEERLEEWNRMSWLDRTKKKGDLSLQFRRYREALKYYRKLESEGKPEVLHNMGVVEMNLNQYDKAIAHFQTAFKIGKNVESLTSYLLALLVDRQYDTLFLELIKYSKVYSDGRLWYVFGLYYEHNNDLDSALESYYKAICAEHNNLNEPYERVAKILISRGQETTAYKAIQDLRDINLMAYNLILSYIYEALLESEKAINILENQDVEEKDKAKIYYRLSQLYEKERQMTTAIDYIEKAKLLEPNDPAILLRVGRLDKKAGNIASYHETVDTLMNDWKSRYRKQIS